MTDEEIQALLAENKKLRTEVTALQEQVTQLTSQLQVAVAQIAELDQEKKKPPPFVKRNRRPRTEPAKPRKKRAAKHNRSRKREEATRTERHALENCPDCDYQLQGENIDYSRQVIEIPPPQAVEVIEHQVIRRWCPHCEGWRSPKLDPSGQVIGRRRIGVRIASLVAYLRTTLRLPVRQV